jgi:DNA-binding beta-propeller fold protein YncE
MFASSWFRPSSKAERPAIRLAVEQLEDRLTPSGSYLLVSSYKTDNVLRYDADTGAFVDEFLPHRSGGLNQPWGVVIGPHDHNVYVSTGHFKGEGQIKAVLSYDGDTGAFLDEVVQTGQMNEPHAVTFGPDGNLYVGDRVAPDRGRIARFDGTTGAYLDDFVPVLSGGLAHPLTHVFGPNGRGGLDLYVSNGGGGILRYDGTTGAFVGTFVPGGSGGLNTPLGMVFGPDGNLYVAEPAFFGGTPAVLRFQGPTGPTPGAFLDAFVPADRGGLLQPFGVLFGPDRNGDGRQDLYVTSDDPNESGFKTASPHTGSVKVYDGVTGAYLSDFVTEGSGGLREATLMTFTETDPVTLAYRGGGSTAAIPGPDTVNATLPAALPNPAQADGHAIRLDGHAAGWGWLLDPTTRDDSPFATSGDHGQQNDMNFLGALIREMGHPPGQEPEDEGAMAEIRPAGTPPASTDAAFADADWLVALPDWTG